MKFPLIKSLILVLLVLGLSYIYFSEEKQGLSYERINSAANNKVTNKAIDIKEVDLNVKPDSKQNPQIEKIKVDVQERYEKIQHLTGENSGKRMLSYEDNWCINNEDLTENDADYAEEQLKNWRLSRGYAKFWEGGNELANGLDLHSEDFPGENDELLNPYREADKNTLLRLADNDDMRALTTMINSNDYEMYDLRERFEISKKLIVLGDTSTGLINLVIYRLSKAQSAQRTGKDPVGYLKSALAYIEFGMMRGDAYSLSVLIRKLSGHDSSFSGLDPSKILDNEDFIEINQLARSYFDWANEVRHKKGLPSFEDVNDHRVSTMNNNNVLSEYYRDYPEIMESDFFPESWQKTYLKKTPCVERMVAKHHFLMTDIPKMREKIGKLEEDLEL
ncbi:hypothetical protein ORJ66_19545 [Pseudoalteromonas tunicata]|uniref:hypothetical protein n=1 Tax=Pseudoalteromonas tunicata TaxID=314281 RepID=UPI00273D1593|nr:hypothetical protein [Pseudoalteromonas tunicata]MDP5215256.1 hypothetical protein [Pseudoalteromonas tunicata]